MKRSLIAGLAFAFAASTPAAAQITLTFEGVGDQASVNDFYNGGTDSQGHSGTNYGISFSPASLGLIEVGQGGSGNQTNEPSPFTILFFLSGSAATMNVAAGFDTGFSFYYGAFQAGSVTVWDGLNGTGNILATLDLPANGAPSEWTPIGIAFAGIAHSVDFSGVANQVAFDNITLGDVIPGNPGVPEPASWAMMLAGFGIVGGAIRNRRRTVVTFA